MTLTKKSLAPRLGTCSKPRYVARECCPVSDTLPIRRKLSLRKPAIRLNQADACCAQGFGGILAELKVGEMQLFLIHNSLHGSH